MAAQKVQVYLEKHKIGGLFEDLMAKVIHEMPSDPVSYLIKSLKKIQNDESGKVFSPGLKGRPPSGQSQGRNLGLTGTPIGRSSSLDVGTNKRNMLAKSWAGPDSHHADPYASTAKPRDYSRPWLSGSRPIRAKSTEKDNLRRERTPERTKEREPWNRSTITPTQDFDELFEMRQKAKTESTGNNAGYYGAQSWSQADLDTILDKPAFSGLRRREAKPSGVPVSYDNNDDDDFERELLMGKDISTDRATSETSSGVSSYSSLKSGKLSRKPKYAAEEHRRQLQALLMSNSQSASRSDYGSKLGEQDDLQDDGTDLLENYDDLQSEGVTGATISGTRMSKSLRSAAGPTENVRVSICARCARIITGMPSEQKLEVGSTFSSMSEVDDDNFESVSQAGSVRGRANQVWPTGFDTESEPSPRKGKHMWESNEGKSPKGKHMYRSGYYSSQEPYDSSRPQSAASERSDNQFFSSQRRPDRFSGYSSDEETDTSNFRRVGSPDLVRSGRQWTALSADNASESEAGGWTRPSSGQKFRTRFSRLRNGADSDD